MLASTEQIRCRGLRERPNDIRMATKSCDIKLYIGIAWINVNQNSSTSLGQSAINNWVLKAFSQAPNLTPSSAMIHDIKLVVRSSWKQSDQQMPIYVKGKL